MDWVPYPIFALQRNQPFVFATLQEMEPFGLRRARNVPIQEAEKIHERQYRDEMPVQLSPDCSFLLFRPVRRHSCYAQVGGRRWHIVCAFARWDDFFGLWFFHRCSFVLSGGTLPSSLISSLLPVTLR